MLRHRRSSERGSADHGWLKTRHTFSFGSYFDPNHMGFGALRVINQDLLGPASGFPMHGHRDMEIVTYVLQGALRHEDSMGNVSEVRAGEVQVMSAGTGVRHSERNASSEEPLHLLQMWVHPYEDGLQPSYSQKDFSIALQTGGLLLAASPSGESGSLCIHQDARLLIASLKAGQRTEHLCPDQSDHWVHVATGSLEVNGEAMQAGDSAGAHGVRSLHIKCTSDASLVIWELQAGAR